MCLCMNVLLTNSKQFDGMIRIREVAIILLSLNVLLINYVYTFYLKYNCLLIKLSEAIAINHKFTVKINMSF